MIASETEAPTAADAPIEVELKYTVDDAGAIIAWLDEHFPPAHDAGWRTLQISDRYFDTADGALRAAGYGVRLRTVGSDTTLTLKATIQVDGALHRRLELEAPATRSLDPGQWPDSEARSRVVEVIGDRRLIERFVIGLERRERTIAVDGTTVVASLDDGEAEYLSEPAGELHQFEIELRDGAEGALAEIAEQVAASGLARAETRSKVALVEDMLERAARVAPGDRWSDAARKVLRRHLVRMLERERATRDGDPLALKQMRVATRRMRATWRAFARAFAGGHARDFDTRLRHVAGLLGAVRDLDVLLESVESRPEVAPLQEGWRTRRDAAFDELVRHLDSRAYERFVDEFIAGTGARAYWNPGKHAHDTVAELAPEQLERARAQMLEAAADASDSNDSAAWHELRITAKRMRYALEAFRDVLDERAATDFIEPLRSLQDNLGSMNDASVAAREATAWLSSAAAVDASPERRVAVVRYVGNAEAFVGKARREFPTVWAPVAQAPVPPVVRQPN